MPRKCLICKTPPLNSVTLFGFPKNEELRRVWAEFCDVEVESLLPSHKICSRHFTLESFKFTVKEGCKCALKKDAIPTLRRFAKESSTNPANNPAKIVSTVNQQKFKIKKKQPNKNSYRVCAKHFTPDDFVTVGEDGRKLRLKKSSVPTLIQKLADTSKTNINNAELLPEFINVGCDSSIYKSEELLNTRSSGADESDCVIENMIIDGSPIEDITINTFDISSSTSKISRKRKYPRYVGDISLSQLQTPKCAKRCLEIVRKTVYELRKQNESLKSQNKTLKKKVTALEESILRLFAIVDQRGSFISRQ